MLNVEVSEDIFRAYDIRGIVDTVLTAEVVTLVGRAFGTLAKRHHQNTVVVGRDGRLSSPMLSEALIEGLRSTGCDVIDIGLVPTPVLYFATHVFETGTGIMITGSHNPPDYNGLKMMVGGGTLHGDDITGLYTQIQGEDFIQADQGSLREEAILQQYVERIVRDINIERDLKVAVDCGNGAASVIAVELLQKLGLEPEVLYCEVDGNFPNHHPDPSKEANLTDLIRTVKEHQLDLGLAFDGDGDRLGVIDAQGQIIWPDREMILFAKDILGRNPGATVIYDVKCTSHLKQAISEAGGNPVMSKTGHSLIKAKMKETGALLAGEMSGHIFFKERWYGFDDGLYTMARLLEILAKDKRTPTDVFADLPDSINTPELNIKFAEGEHYQFIEAFQQQAQFPDADITDIDGVRADFADGWGLVRASNTTPSLVIRFEADNEDALTRIKNQFRQQMLAVDSQLALPF